MIVSGGQQMDSAIHIHVSILPQTPLQGIVREFGMDLHALLYLKWVTNKDVLWGTGNSARCYAAAWREGEAGGERMHVYAWLSSFAVHLKLSQHC